MSDLTEKFDQTLRALEISLNGRDDFFVTSSFGFQSALLFHALSYIGRTVNCISIESPLSVGGLDKQKDYILSRYDLNLTIVDRADWLESQLRSREFLELPEDARVRICRDLKRAPLLEYIAKKSRALGNRNKA